MLGLNLYLVESFLLLLYTILMLSNSLYPITPLVLDFHKNLGAMIISTKNNSQGTSADNITEVHSRDGLFS